MTYFGLLIKMNVYEEVPILFWYLFVLYTYCLLIEGRLLMGKSPEELIVEFLCSIALQDALDGKYVRNLLEEIRMYYDLDCVFVFENLTFRNDFVYSYYSTKEGYESKLGTIVQFTDAEYEERLRIYNGENIYERLYIDPMGRQESTLRYGFITGETYYGSVTFRCYSDKKWSDKEKETLKKLGRVLRMVLDSKYRRRLREERSQKVLRLLEQNFEGVYYINIIGNSFQTVNVYESVLKTKEILSYDEFIKYYKEKIVYTQDAERFEQRFCRQALQESLLKGNSIEDYFCIGTHEETYWERVHAILADTDGYGNIYHVALTITDVTKEHAQIEELNRKIVKADQAKSDFLAQTSHDIRTPMNAVLGYAQLARIHSDDKQRQEKYLQKIETSGKYLISLLNDILDFSKIESGKLEIIKEPFNLYECVENCIDMFRENAKTKNIEFTVQNGIPVNTFIGGDSVRFAQIFSNIISNAIKYTEKGYVWLEFAMSEFMDKLKFVCTDTGIGMDEEFIKHIGRPYERNEKDVHGIMGTGLGMAITGNLIEALEGDMQITSTPGKGTTFLITLPISIEENIDDISDRVSKEVDFNGQRVLLVDDNELNREIASELMESISLQVECAANGKEAVECIERAQSDYYCAVLMDVQMPVMDGYEATGQIRQMTDPKKAGIPIIAMTANAYPHDMLKSKETGMNDHLNKPIDMKVMKKTLTKYLT